MHTWSDDNHNAFLKYFDIEQANISIVSTNYKVVYVGKRKPLYKTLEKLEKNNKWKRVYDDYYSAIFQKL